ncbi:MAG: hypothetical protein ABJB39_04210 [Chloroflexota bacterium]
MSAATGHRIRWTAVWACVAAWFVALALNIAGNLVHLLLLAAIGILVYELLVEDDHRGQGEGPLGAKRPPPENPAR